MAWKRGGPVDPKYRSAEHRQLRAHYVRLIKAGIPVECMAPVCEFGHAPITNPNGMDPDGLNLGHEDDGVTYRGPEHRLDNVKDGARRGRARQDAGARRWAL